MSLNLDNMVIERGECLFKTFVGCSQVLNSLLTITWSVLVMGRRCVNVERPTAVDSLVSDQRYGMLGVL